MTDDEKYFENFTASIEFDDTPEVRHRDRLEDDLRAALAQRLLSKRTAKTWRRIVKSRIAKFATAAVVILAVTLSMTILDKSATPAYAIGQTIKAIDTIETVYFSACFYKQGPVECWMKFAENSKRPTHMALFLTPWPIRKIDKPEGAFAYNERTNRVRRNTRDERKMNWYLDFSAFFKLALKSARRSDTVRIVRQTDPDLQKEVIVIHVDEGDRECKYLIDPETKLPISFSTTRTDDITKYLRKTIAVKYMDRIEYNKPIPDGMFDFPEDAEFVSNEHDVMVHPGVGMPIEGLTQEQACVKIIKDTIKAMGDLDWETVTKLYFPFFVPPKELLAQLKLDQYKQPLVELQKLGQPYKQGDYWFVHCTIREPNGKTKEETFPIKFYAFDGKSYCIIAYED